MARIRPSVQDPIRREGHIFDRCDEDPSLSYPRILDGTDSHNYENQ